MSLESRCLAVAVVAGSLLVLGGCGQGAGGGEAGGEENPESSASLGQAISSGWSSMTSDEYAPVNCDGSSLINGFDCRGRYCDTMRISCTPTAGVRNSAYSSYWTVPFSDGTSGTSQTCNPGYWATGLACKGDYCDNVSLQCTFMSNISAKNCYWTGWTSEEQGIFNFPSGYYARGAQCSGDYCDNLRYYICQP